MPGAAIRVEFDDAEVRRALARLLAAGGDLAPLMRDIGEALLDATRDRFEDERAPDSAPWALLSETTKKRKTRNIDRILAESGERSGRNAEFPVSAGRLRFRIGLGDRQQPLPIHAGFVYTRQSIGTRGRPWGHCRGFASSNWPASGRDRSAA